MFFIRVIQKNCNKDLVFKVNKKSFYNEQNGKLSNPIKNILFEYYCDFNKNNNINDIQKNLLLKFRITPLDNIDKY